MENYVPSFSVKALECDSSDIWTLHTPFDVTIEKTGDKTFSKTVSIDAVGGKDAVTLANPYDPTEKLTVINLGKIGTGYGQPPTSGLLILNGTIAFEKTDQLVKAISYGRDLQTGQIIQDERPKPSHEMASGKSSKPNNNNRRSC
ncbi:MAG: hypothetical protein ACKD6N_07040 [Candidatus Bathyarchaeota archaeon]